MSGDQHSAFSCLPTEDGDPRDMAIARQAVEIEELRMALGKVLDKVRQVNTFMRQALELTARYM